MKKLLLTCFLSIVAFGIALADNYSDIWQPSSDGAAFSKIVEPDHPRKFYDNGGPERNMPGNYYLTEMALKPALSGYHITVVFEQMDLGTDYLKIYNGYVPRRSMHDEDGEYYFTWPGVTPLDSLHGNPANMPHIISSTADDGQLTVLHENVSSTMGWVATVYCVKNGDPEPGAVVATPNYQFTVNNDLGVDEDDYEIEETTINMTLRAGTDNAALQVDWGDGELIDYTIVKANQDFTVTRDVEAGATVKIYGDMTLLDLSGNREIVAFEGNQVGNNVPQMQVLRLTSNKIAQLGVDKLVNLKELAITSNRVGSIDLSKLTQLEEFYGAYNPYTELNTSANPLLDVLTCYNTKISTLDLSKNPKLKVLKIGDNPNLTVPNLANNSAILSLDMDHLSLQTLDLSILPRLQKLTVVGCGLTALNVAQNPDLYDLNIIGNALDACALNDLMLTLPPIASADSSVLRLSNNPGAIEAQTSLAQGNGWKTDVHGTGEGCATVKYLHQIALEGTFKTLVGGTVYASMQAIAKGATVQLVATPMSGYELTKVFVNNDTLDIDKVNSPNKTEFQATQYSHLAAVFERSASLTEVSSKVNVVVTNGHYEVSGLVAATPFSVYDDAGRLIATGKVDVSGNALVRATGRLLILKAGNVVVKLF